MQPVSDPPVSAATPTRQNVPIAVTLCMGCYAAIPAECIEAHERWHDERAARRVVG